MTAFTLPAPSAAEVRDKHRDVLRRLGAARDMLRIAEFTDSIAERNRRAIWGAIKAPSEDAAVNRDSLPLTCRGLRLVEKVCALATAPKSRMTFHLHSPWDDDEMENLHSSNRQFGPIGADAGQPRGCRPQIPLAPRGPPSPSFPPRHAKCRHGKETR
jgi:hypothetical protein